MLSGLVIGAAPAKRTEMSEETMTDLFSYAPEPSYPNAPGFKENDTSRAAADSMKSATGELQRKCLKALVGSPMTADQIAEAIGETPFSTRPRLTELLALGKVCDAGFRCRNASGRSAKAWKLT